MRSLLKIPIYLLVAALSMPLYAMDDVPDGLPDHIVGDIGAAVYTSNLHIGTEGAQSLVLPYAFFDYQRFFARIDEVGMSCFTLPRWKLLKK